MENDAFSRAEVSEYEHPLAPGAYDRSERGIADTAREFGLTPRALRFYESRRLIRPRREGAVRFYGPSERQRLGLIVKAKALGFTLGEIREMLEASHAGGYALSMSRRQCHEQIKLLEQRKRDIEAALAELRKTYSSFYIRLLGDKAPADAP